MNKSKFIFSALGVAFFLSCSDTGNAGVQNGNDNNIGTCGGKEYDSALYDCVRGEIVGSCRGRNYYPEYERCENGEIKSNVGISSSSLLASSSSFAASSSSSFSLSSSSSRLQSSSSVASSSSSLEPSSSSSFVSSSSIIYGSLTYQGQTYKTVKIGEQTWMAENLNYAVGDSQCATVLSGAGNSTDANTAYCDAYGRLYDWTTAMNISSEYKNRSYTPSVNHQGVCPSGWHIPSNEDWDKLLRFVDGTTGTSSPYESLTAGKHLKAKTGWNDLYGNGLDTYGFSALPGGGAGGCVVTAPFCGIGSYGHWWSSNEYSLPSAHIAHKLEIGSDVISRTGSYKTLFSSVRCVQN